MPSLNLSSTPHATELSRTKRLSDHAFFTAVSQTASRALVSTLSGDVLVLDLRNVQSPHLCTTYTLHKGAVYGVSLSADGTLAASASQDGFVHVWDARCGRNFLNLYYRNHDHAFSVALSHDATTLLVSYIRKTALSATIVAYKLMPPSSAKEITSWSVPAVSGQTDVSLSADGRFAAFGAKGRVVVASVCNGRELVSWSAKGDVSVALNSTGSKVYIADAECLRVGNVSLKSTTRFIGYAAALRPYVAVGNDDAVVIAAVAGNQFRAWSVTARTRYVALPHKDAVRGAALSASANIAVTAGYDNVARVWELTGFEKEVHAEAEERECSRQVQKKEENKLEKESAMLNEEEEEIVGSKTTARAAFVNALVFYKRSSVKDLLHTQAAHSLRVLLGENVSLERYAVESALVAADKYATQRVTEDMFVAVFGALEDATEEGEIAENNGNDDTSEETKTSEDTIRAVFVRATEDETGLVTIAEAEMILEDFAMSSAQGDTEKVPTAVARHANGASLDLNGFIRAAQDIFAEDVGAKMLPQGAITSQ